MTTMLTICLVIPPSLFLLDERVFMTLGILKVAAALEQFGITVEMLDLSGVANYEEAIRTYAAGSVAKIFGLTATTPQMVAVGRIQQVLRATRPDARLILGGPHVTLGQAAAKKEHARCDPGRATRALTELSGMFDVLVAGDGEVAIFRALEDDPPPLIDADDPKSELFLDNAQLTNLPFPARHLVDVQSYHYSVDGVRALSLIAQLGCPFECGFCGGRASPSLRRVRMRTTQSVVQEMVHLHQTYGVNGFMLYDDELNVNPKMIELMAAIRSEEHTSELQSRLH